MAVVGARSPLALLQAALPRPPPPPVHPGSPPPLPQAPLGDTPWNVLACSCSVFSCLLSLTPGEPWRSLCPCPARTLPGEAPGLLHHRFCQSHDPFHALLPAHAPVAAPSPPCADICTQHLVHTPAASLSNPPVPATSAGTQSTTAYLGLLFLETSISHDVSFPRSSQGSPKTNKQKNRTKRVWVCMCACVLSHFSRVRLCETPWTVVRWAPLSTGFSRQEYWSGLPCPPPGDLPDPGIKPHLMPPALADGSLPLVPSGKPHVCAYVLFFSELVDNHDTHVEGPRSYKTKFNSARL